MLLAILSDIHANLEALNACLEHARRAGATRYAFLGDLVGYGADPRAVLEIVAEHVAHGAIAVKGNHDVAAADGDTSCLNYSAAMAIEWTRTRLAPAHARFIDELPLCIRDEGACYVHASACRPGEWEYVDSWRAAARSAHAADRPVTFSGHVHDQKLYVSDMNARMAPLVPLCDVEIALPALRCVALVGSAGQPRDGNPAAAYATVDFGARVMRFHRVPYDHHAAASKIRQAGLPESLAYRLERGA